MAVLTFSSWLINKYKYVINIYLIMILERKVFDLEEGILPFKDQIIQTFTSRFFHSFKNKLGK